MDEDKEKENDEEEIKEEIKEENEEEEEKKKEKKKVKKEKIIDEIPFRQGFETSVERTAPTISEPEREIRERRLEDSLADVEIKKPVEEKEKKEFQYDPIYEEKGDQKYTTTRIEIFEARKDDFELVTTTPIKEFRELKNPLAREVKVGHGRYDEVIKYEKVERENDTPVAFGPEFKHPEKKVKKYKTKY